MNSSNLGVVSRAPRQLRRVLDRILSSSPERNDWISVEDVGLIAGARGEESVAAVCAVADYMRNEYCGNIVTYVKNRNINFTNSCTKRCGFCAFSRTGIDNEAYFLPLEEIVNRAIKAEELGATEICIQAGLPAYSQDGSQWNLKDYIKIASAVKDACPEMHLHAFSPEEVYHSLRGSGKNGVSSAIQALKDAGVNSMPGTSAEILDDDLRHKLAAGRLSTRQWIECVTSAHTLGIKTTATMMFGHLETPQHVAAHLILIRDLQRLTGGFTEFVPLPFVAAEAPIFRKKNTQQLRPGPTSEEVFSVHAASRIVLAGTINNIQCSWPKLGLKTASNLLSAGVNDLGGTLINESISTAAGAKYGQFATPRDLKNAAILAGREPRQRTTLYDILDTSHDDSDELDRAKADFGSFHGLIASSRWRARDYFGLKRNRRSFSTYPNTTERAQNNSKIVTISPAYTIVLTYECFNSCGYCNFKSRGPTGDTRNWMTIDQARKKLRGLRDTGVVEILIIAGEVSPQRSQLRKEWLNRALALCEVALDFGLLPHVNIGPLSKSEMAQIGSVSASMGLMLESLRSDLAFHARAPSKKPQLRLEQLNQAGELGIPFTTGFLLGLSDLHDLDQGLQAVASAHDRFGHIQEVILQPLSPPKGKSLTSTYNAFDLNTLPRVVQRARSLLPNDISIQVPPNLVGGSDILHACLDAGATDLGGISPKDEVNPHYAFPTPAHLENTLAEWGYQLRPRLPVHDKWFNWLPPRVRPIADKTIFVSFSSSASLESSYSESDRIF